MTGALATEENQKRQPPGRLARAAVPVLGLWTLFVWGSRVRNLSNEPGGLADAGQWSLWGSVVFCVLALAMLAAQVGGSPLVRSGSVLALATFTTVIWLIRAVDIALGDHSVGFIVVHVVLAVISIGLAVAATLQAEVRVPFGRWVSQ